MARVQGAAALPVLRRVFLGLGITLGLAAAGFATARANTLSSYAHADGTVVSLHLTGRSYHPVVAFSPAGAASVQFESGTGSRPPAFRVGEPVGVRYSPADPRQAFIDLPMHLWFFPILLAILGSSFTLVGLSLWLLGQARRS